MPEQDQPILHETLAAVAEILRPQPLAVERVAVGLFYTGVKLANGVAGACATPSASLRETFCCPDPAAMPFPGTLRGRDAFELARQSLAADPILRAVGIATLNALADTAWRRRPHPLMELRSGVDAFDATPIGAADKVVLVGAFVPFLKALKARRQPFLVLERNPATLKPEEMPFYRPAEAAASVVPDADVLLVTGTTLLNDTLEGLLGLARPDARVTIVGPTVGLLPDAFLARGADILGGIRIVAPDEFLDVVAEGGAAHHFLGRSAEKVVLVRRASAAAAA